jgi:broad specificity phosphatase PhoE
MYLFIIRHTESEKNIEDNFSSEMDLEPLTEVGANNSAEIANHIADFIKRKSLISKRIYTANSIRAKETAIEIAKKLDLELCEEEALRSIKPGVLKDKKLGKNSHPEYMQQYYLFEKGVFNSYDFNVPENKEPKKDFENRVNSCIDRIISDDSENVKIIVAHRSSITTMLLEFAKKYHRYPTIFSGYIYLELGNVSVLKREDNGIWKILKVNEKIGEIINEL